MEPRKGLGSEMHQLSYCCVCRRSHKRSGQHLHTHIAAAVNLAVEYLGAEEKTHYDNIRPRRSVSHPHFPPQTLPKSPSLITIQRMYN